MRVRVPSLPDSPPNWLTPEYPTWWWVHFASSFQGVRRSSQDLDLVIDPQPESLRRFLSDLPPKDYYADADAAFDALRRRG